MKMSTKPVLRGVARTILCITACSRNLFDSIVKATKSRVVFPSEIIPFTLCFRLHQVGTRGLSTAPQQSLLSSSLVPHTGAFNQVRFRYITYRPNAAKRIKKTGWQKRTSSRTQLEILWRRVIKGRFWLAKTNSKKL